MSDDATTCYERGREYRRTGRMGPDTACPYPDGGEQAKWWKRGWEDENEPKRQQQ